MPETKPRILCLDDQEEHLRLRKVFLEQFGCEVVTVQDANSCLDVASREQFDLAILDYHLGGEITGEHVAHDLRSCTPRMPLLMLTGDPLIPESAKQSVDAVFIKGTGTPADLLEVIQTLMPERPLKVRRKPISREELLQTTHAHSAQK